MSKLSKAPNEIKSVVAELTLHLEMEMPFDAPVRVATALNDKDAAPFSGSHEEAVSPKTGGFAGEP